MLGCGNSRLTEDMYYDGYEEVENLDISRVVVDQMSEKYQEIEGMTWRQSDVCDQVRGGARSEATKRCEYQGVSEKLVFFSAPFLTP